VRKHMKLFAFRKLHKGAKSPDAYLSCGLVRHLRSIYIKISIPWRRGEHYDMSRDKMVPTRFISVFLFCGRTNRINWYWDA